jgi:glutamate-1-semialdehyde 2,1-aminomutase
MQQSRSQQLFEQAQRVIPGGVNSPVRSFRAVAGTPPFPDRGQGSRVWDVDGNVYIDYPGSWGPLALGTRIPWWWRQCSGLRQTARRSGSP